MRLQSGHLLTSCYIIFLAECCCQHHLTKDTCEFVHVRGLLNRNFIVDVLLVVVMHYQMKFENNIYPNRGKTKELEQRKIMILKVVSKNCNASKMFKNDG